MPAATGTVPRVSSRQPRSGFLRTCTVPETLRALMRSPQRRADHAMLQAAATARQRLATDERCIGTALPGFTGVLPTWGRQLPYHPHLHAIVPGGGLSAAHAAWWPSRANFFVPVNALSPISRALFKDDMRHAGLLEHLAPQVWHLPWNVHSQATHHGHAACTSLAPSVCRGTIANSRLVALTDRTVPFTARKVGSARPRTAHLDVMACLRRCLQPVVPDGCVKVRHGGFLHASCAIPPATLRLLRGQGHPRDDPPPPLAVRCPTGGAPMRVVMRLWTANNGFVATGCEAGRCPDDRGAIRCVHPTAPVRPPPALWPHKAAQDGSATASQRPAYASRRSSDAPLAMPHHGVRRTPPTLS